MAEIYARSAQGIRNLTIQVSTVHQSIRELNNYKEDFYKTLRKYWVGPDEARFEQDFEQITLNFVGRASGICNDITNALEAEEKEFARFQQSNMYK